MEIIIIKSNTCTKREPLGNFIKGRGCSKEIIIKNLELYNPSNHEIPLSCHDAKLEIV